jgi:hypothetical protein
MPFSPVNYRNPGNPFMEGIGQGVGLGQNLRTFPHALQKIMLENQKAQAELPYAGALSAANVMSKSSYGQWAPITPLVNLLSNPNIREMLPPAQLNHLTGILSRQLSSPQAYDELLGQNDESNIPGSNNNGLHQSIMNNRMPGLQQGSQQPQQMGYEQEFGEGNRASPEMIRDVAEHGNNNYGEQKQGGLPPTRFNRNAAQYNVPGSQGGANPQAYAKAQEAGLNTAATSEAQMDQDIYKNMLNNASVTSKGSQSTLNNLNKFHNNYLKLNKFEKGFPLGYGPRASDAAQIADQSSGSLVADVTRAYQEGRITDENLKTFERNKIGRFMNKKAEQATYEYMKAMTKREKEYLPFVVAARKKDLSSGEIDILWSKYISDRSFYDEKKNKVNEKNLDTWREYLTPNKIIDTLYSQKKNPGNDENKVSAEINKRNKNENTKMIDNVEYTRNANGEWEY